MNIYTAGPEYKLSPLFGMTTRHEQAYCWDYGRRQYQGLGEWVELGTFLGSLTIPSALGLRENESRRAREKKIRVFDLFFFDSVMCESVKGTQWEWLFTDGEWYEEKYRQITAPVADQLVITQADLTKAVYQAGPIEFLLMDILKYEALVQNVTKSFFPALMPNVSRVLSQDYLHFYEGWSTLQMYSLKDAFEPDTIIDNSGSVVFKMVGEIKELPDFPDDSQGIEKAWVEESFDWSRSFLPEKFHPMAYAAEAMMHVHRRDFESAGRLNRVISERGWDNDGQVVWFREYVAGNFPEADL